MEALLTAGLVGRLKHVLTIVLNNKVRDRFLVAVTTICHTN